MGGYEYDFSVISQNMDIFIEGALKTLEISAIALLLAIPLGIIIGMGRISRNRFIRILSSAYVEVMRGVPLLVLLIWIFFVLGQFLKLGSYWASIIGLAVFTAAFIAEIVRSGIQGVPRGQMEAARSSGMTYWQAMRLIVLPQAFRRVLPPLASQFIMLIKDSSLISVIGATELTLNAKNLVATTMRSIEIWTFIGFVYFAMTFTLSMIIRAIEQKLLARENS
ncbi:nickel transporter [Sporosarcina sp. P37]|uniref:amino acid ABC transporter permease n=2 Tax=Sporosarcina TaxID=1569 RepID=UPI0009BFB2F6|nr:amino acid ABC transporter permease [Sporosarcina sp. P33]ARD48713.1 nickel transporter [Sporosarcina sp. P33]ARK25220.1 nickel transporter [Sporosarcina sp. P37]PID17173.1 amino acid ABC transporter permease [Sporosarcina sp. P35]